MELRDVILSTLAEMEDNNTDNSVSLKADFKIKEVSKKLTRSDSEKEFDKQVPHAKMENMEESYLAQETEVMFLNGVRERLLVLFEGFQAPNNTNIEAKVDLTLNFLEYVLASIDSRVEKLEKGKIE
ncbi:hypothetical protein KKG72_05010 [bacterium]|nr:hypothetical protein [bacterium]MBU1995444.1 hypothetical protein [bacterium]